CLIIVSALGRFICFSGSKKVFNLHAGIEDAQPLEIASIGLRPTRYKRMILADRGRLERFGTPLA
ncbi:MAG: hypothetical protein QOF72_2787, partial [Blastocatellia bacterium]|nr:hypothetical protein [Blastocatellia bacterium]